MGPGFESPEVHQPTRSAPKTRGNLEETPKSTPEGIVGMNSYKRKNTTVVSVFNAVGPPVPIPNTEVKRCSGENTWLATAREDNS